MKKMTKILALVLVLVMILSFGACSKEESITGKWSTDIDMDKMMNAAGEAEGGDDAAEFVEMMKGIFKGVTLKINLTLNEDGTYVMASDENATKAAAETIMNNIKENLPEMADFIDADSVMDEFGGDMEAKGTYTYADGKLTLTGEGDSADEAMVWVVELKSSELRVTDVEGEDDESFKAMLPLVFTK